MVYKTLVRLTFFCHMIFRAVFVVFVFLNLSALANEGPGSESLIHVFGHVTEEGTGEELTGACIRIKGTDQEVYTGRNGEFELPVGVTPGTELEISFVSFETVTLSVEQLIVSHLVVLKSK
jgi:hypothetical protein